MKRRVVVGTFGALLWPTMAATQPARVPKIGILVIGNPDPQPFLKVFRAGLHELGYDEGRNVTFDFRSAEHDASRLPGLAAGLVRSKVDVIVAYLTPPTMAAKQATADIPIVMAGVGDPVGAGLVANLSRPEGNLTGTSTSSSELAGKSIELVREVLPSAQKVCVLANATDAFTKPFLEQLNVSAARANLDLQPFMVRSNDEADTALLQMKASHCDAVVVPGSLQRPRLIELLSSQGLPSVSPNTAFSRSGGLMSYSANLVELGRETAIYVDKILKGAKPGDLPIQQPTRFELIVNLKTAKALGVTVPAGLLSRADEVIE